MLDRTRSSDRRLRLHGLPGDVVPVDAALSAQVRMAEPDPGRTCGHRHHVFRCRPTKDSVRLPRCKRAWARSFGTLQWFDRNWCEEPAIRRRLPLSERARKGRNGSSQTKMPSCSRAIPSRLRCITRTRRTQLCERKAVQKPIQILSRTNRTDATADNSPARREDVTRAAATREHNSWRYGFRRTKYQTTLVSRASEDASRLKESG
jgi:hypothetical protein